jgi:hypothetical protein
VTTLVGGVIVVVFGYLIWPSQRHIRVSAPFDGDILPSGTDTLYACPSAIASGTLPEVESPISIPGSDRRPAPPVVLVAW